MKTWFDLLFTFVKMGCITFGGGYAMLPVIERELVDRKGWVTMDEVMDYFALGQVTPGVIAVNVSTFVGYKKKGILGGVLSTVGFILPSLVIITLIAAFLRNFTDLAPVQHAFRGIRVAVGALILNAVIKLGKGAIREKKSLLICIAAFGLSAFFRTSPVLIVLGAALAGLLLYRRKPPPRPPEGGA
ncbi:MAG: chromate transporter [Spirochaetaceae bacterium]|nr:chromate transporter [Spirochaetaceae bacterium]